MVSIQTLETLTTLNMTIPSISVNSEQSSWALEINIENNVVLGLIKYVEIQPVVMVTDSFIDAKFNCKECFYSLHE